MKKLCINAVQLSFLCVQSQRGRCRLTINHNALYIVVIVVHNRRIVTIVLVKSTTSLSCVQELNGRVLGVDVINTHSHTHTHPSHADNQPYIQTQS